ncbi:MAG: ATP-binding protein [Armatimonadetes bacterium]|nr:ATP-binding protein [Armatimonadota bacterium]
MSLNGQSDVVELRIPCKPEFVSVARLAILGIASRMQLSYDEVEDVRLAVGEACTTAVERAKNAAKTDTYINIRSEISNSKLTIEVEDEVPTAEIRPSEEAASPENIDEQSLGALLMELLVDEIQVEQTPKGGTLVRMVKYAG